MPFFMRQPLGYEDEDAPHHLCKLDKALYGLKQAPRAWYSKLSAKLKSLGFATSKADSSLFFYSKGPCTIYILVYVDDIINASSSDKFTNTLIKNLNQEFALKDLKGLHYFMGIEVKQSSKEPLMTQERYSRDILKWVNMQTCKPISTPMPSYEKLLINDGVLLGPKDTTQYRSTVGALRFLTLTRPGLSFSVNWVCQFLHNLTTVHWEFVKRILWYIQGTLQYGLKFKKSSSMILSRFSYADWAGCPNDRSTSRFAIFLGTNLIS
jgi:hypothetical protein